MPPMATSMLVSALPEMRPPSQSISRRELGRSHAGSRSLQNTRFTATTLKGLSGAHHECARVSCTDGSRAESTSFSEEVLDDEEPADVRNTLNTLLLSAGVEPRDDISFDDLWKTVIENPNIQYHKVLDDLLEIGLKERAGIASAMDSNGGPIPGQASGGRVALRFVTILQELGKSKGLPAGGPPMFRAFGAAHQVPQRPYSLDDMRLNKIDPSSFLAPTDRTLNGVRSSISAATSLAFVAGATLLHPDAWTLLGWILWPLSILGVDTVLNGGGGQALILDSLARKISPSYSKRVASHEAGHFLVSYLMGILPLTYAISAQDAYKKYRAFNVQAGTQFVDDAWQQEISTGKVSSVSLGKFSCIALAGISAEWVVFSASEGGIEDIRQLESILRATGFTEAKAASQVRWAVLNTVFLLRRHRALHARLTECMETSASVGDCVQLIEEELSRKELSEI